MKRFDYYIFDFDGTVVDTGEGILKSLQYSFEKMGQPIPSIEDLKRFIGPPIKDSYMNFYGVSEDEVNTYIAKYRERYCDVGIFESFAYPGLVELLTALKKGGAKIAIASSKPRKMIFDVMDYLKLTDYFDSVMGASLDESKHITKAQLVTNAMNDMGVTDKSRVVMIGDRFFDIDGAHGAGVEAVGVLWGYGSKEEFIEHKAEYIIASPEEIL